MKTISSIPSESKKRFLFSGSFKREHIAIKKFSTISDSSSDPASLRRYAYYFTSVRLSLFLFKILNKINLLQELLKEHLHHLIHQP